jgi:hypothetical protein
MSGFYVLAVPEFASLVDAATKSGNCKVHPKIGHYQFVEFDGEIEVLRSNTRMNEAVWFGCLTGGLDGKIAHFDGERLKLVSTNEPILGLDVDRR